ncbi:regulatory iron-sulfur-containing complex subunit RicT [Peredibacter sp. HCB2-198]|uniref:PSP1 domain-containing protein n=1 Tax=Peredibacter sp. HCB2-198 TaxID=3383025 RepID=UPI0038B423E3
MTNEQHVEEDKLPPTDTIISEDETSEMSDAETSEDKESREESRFKEGQILRFVRVRFPGNSRSFPFLIGKRRIEYGQKVVAMSDRGMAVGYVNSFPYEVPFNKSMLPVRSIAKVATDEDVQKDQEAYRQQKNAENICNDLIEQFKLDMQLTHVEFTSFGKKAVFYFIAPARVDFRDLVRDLVAKLKTRIELRQISVRDRSASIGGIGPCGRELCCSSFLTKYGNVGIKMAKNQDLTLNFSKLNGVCGQLKCCLQYEDDVYREKRSRLPKEGDIITTHTGETGRVDRLHLLSEQFVMMTNRGVRKRFVVDLYKETLDKETANFPKEFDMITDETHKVVGLDDKEAKKIKAFEAEVKTYKEKGKSFADGIFESLFGEKTLDYSLPAVAELESSKPRVKTPDEEEEIFYTPSEDEILPEDEEEDIVDHEPVRTRVDLMDRGQQASRGDNRGPRPQGQQNRGPRPQGQGPQAPRGDSRGPRQDNRGPRQDNRGPRPQGQNNQNRPQGGGQQGQNQGRNRPPR